MDNLIAAAFELAQECRQHPGGLGLGIVKQDDPASHPIDARQYEAKLLFRRHGVPIARPNVGAENHQSARVCEIEEGGARSKTWKPEERCRWVSRPASVDGYFVSFDPAVDLSLGLGGGHSIEKGMRISVVAKAVAFGQGTPYESRIGGDVSPQQEERGLHAFDFKGV